MMAYIELGMNKHEFQTMTEREFELRRLAKQKQAEEHWQELRVIAYYNALPPMQKAIPIEEFMPLPSDKLVEGDDREPTDPDELALYIQKQYETLKIEQQQKIDPHV